MARRQPYQQTVSAGAPQDTDRDDAIETAEGGLQIVLPDMELEQDPPQPARAAEPEVQPQPQDLAPAPKSADDEAFSRLKAQLERAERERAEALGRQAQAERERSTSEESLRAEQAQLEVIRREHLATQELAIDNAMRVAEREAAAAEEAIQRALEAADYAAAAKAQRILGQADNDLARLREGKTALSQEKTRAAPAPKPEAKSDGGTVPSREPQSDWERVEAYITQPSHPPRVQNYMREHYSDLFANGGARVNNLVAAHYEAKARGLPEFSDEYFKAVDRHMGYDKSSEQTPPVQAAPEPVQPQQREQPPARPKAAIPPAAPVSRGPGNNQVTGTSITLTPAQVQFCRESGLDPKVYARQILAINRGATDANYTGPRWTRDMGA
jgi:hypothetical protein